MKQTSTPVDFDWGYFIIMNTENEIWKDVVGFENLYQVSNFGRVKRKKGETIYKDGRIAHFSETVLKPTIFKKGYLMVYLSKNSIKKTKQVHRIVAEAFIANPENKETINHIDCNKLNNNVSNLEWMTNLENIQHSIENGRYKYREEKRIIDGRKIKNQYS